jgi:hypothetical protein
VKLRKSIEKVGGISADGLRLLRKIKGIDNSVKTLPGDKTLQMLDYIPKGARNPKSPRSSAALLSIADNPSLIGGQEGDPVNSMSPWPIDQPVPRLLGMPYPPRHP